MHLADLVQYLDGYLRISSVPDSPRALNGLQLENAGTVTRVAAAVDFSQASISQAVGAGADLLLVHHGMFWGGSERLTAHRYHRLAGLIRHNVAVYSAHLPLDVHPEVGNNAVLARALGIRVAGSFGEEYGIVIGLWGELDTSRDDLAARITSVLGATPRVLPFGPARVRRVGVLTGSGGSFIAQAEAAGLDTYLTGEGAHHTFFEAEERRLNVLFGGHYATETVGVKALAAHVSEKFHLPWTFLDHPTGM
ncbi:MAG TPA: Nif3-like dinuclear metal center hexameric protein [Gemmatimonadales bacterium]|nr:Nif3-like dinuclear metal center hexameric protein [Gemmatimonadales bacterium]